MPRIGVDTGPMALRGVGLLAIVACASALRAAPRVGCAVNRAALPRMVATISTPAVGAVSFEPQKHTVALVALGCPKNTVDAEVMLGDLQRQGLRIVSDPAEAEVIIVNTCAFVEDAKRESIAAIMEAAQLKADRNTPARALYVTGCMAQRYADELADELPEVDAIVGFESYSQVHSNTPASVDATKCTLCVVE